MSKTALVFPGQGCQYQKMGHMLYEDYDAVKKIFHRANDALGYDLKKICFEGTIRELNEIEHMLCSILTVSVAVYQVYQEEAGIVPSYMAGHSLGEYSALVCSGALKFEDALRLVQLRCQLAKPFQQEGMLTVVDDSDELTILDCFREMDSKEMPVVIGCYNTESQFVLSGFEKTMLQVEKKLADRGAKLTPILSTPPFHSPMLEEITEPFREQVNGCHITLPKCQVISNVSALPYVDVETVKKNLVLQLVMPVRWKQTMDYFRFHQVDTIFEIGPKAILSNLITDRNCKVISFGQKDDRERFIKERKEYDRLQGRKKLELSFATRCYAEAVCTKNRNWDENTYQKGVIEPCEKLESMGRQVDEQGAKESEEEKAQALYLLKLIFQTKKVPVEEQEERLKKIQNFM